MITPVPPAGHRAPAVVPGPHANPALGILLGGAAGRPVHVEHIPGRAGREVPWPPWLPAEVVAALSARGIGAPWSHQAAAACHARAGRNVIISTPAASGKSLGYLMPALAAVLAGDTVLYVTPTRALAADQLASIRALAIAGVQAATFDGDSTAAERAWARSHARYLLTTPDMLHRALLPGHARWSGFFSRLRYVIIDECHGYRGVFGSHVAHVLRRLRRVVAHHAPPGATDRPVFMLASATVGSPAACASLLTGLDAEEVTEDGSPRGPLALALWEPPLTDARGEAGARLRRSATAQAAELLATLVRHDVQTLAFIRSRRGAETVALAARRALGGHDDPEGKVAAYRSGYLAEDRRSIEAAFSQRRLVGLAATTALELGVNITGLDAVLIAGWPGTFSSLWQQAGRAGRAGRSAAAVLIARDDPLDTYLVRHPEMLLQHPVEATVLDPANPYVLAPHLCAAAAELPLTDQDMDIFGEGARPAVAKLARAGRLRRRAAGWYGTRRDTAGAALRGAGLAPVRVVEQATGRLVGTVDEPSAHLLVHDGAVYVHQGESYLVAMLDLADRVALVEPGDPGYTTTARDVTEVEVRGQLRRMTWGEAEVCFGDVQVTRQVLGYTRRRADTGAPLGDVPLDLPPRRLLTRAVWWTVSAAAAAELHAAGVALAGAAHAAEHASIGLLPLFATCDRWDIGGVSAEVHPATGRLTVFVYDGYDGGAGFAERGFTAARDWLGATRQAIASCECEAGCPCCVQSPKCGNGNHPLAKDGAVALLGTVLAGCP
ncbi:MAG: DEAD/DEAH box helicase [Streptosporangiaceae bacterium]|nr:DEAD/DEAH box helicase [Streptosporangiaceae bacterium]